MPDRPGPPETERRAVLDAARSLFADVFATRVEGVLDAMHDELETVTLAAGEPLFRQGDDGDAIYVIVDGRLDVRIRGADGSETTVDTLAPGACVGEMALLTGQTRAATVTAATGATLGKLARAAFFRLADAHPELLDRLTHSAATRLQRTQLHDILIQWFGPLDTSTLHTVHEEMTWLHLEGGETLFRQGEHDDAMFLVVNGRLRILARRPDGTVSTVGEARRGESLGEFSLLTGEPRSATAVAVRDTNVVRLPKSLIERHHQLVFELARSIARRAHANAASTAPRRETAAFTLVPAGPDVPLAAFAARLRAALEEHGPTLSLDASSFDRAFGRDGAAELQRDHPLNDTLTGWLSEREARYAHVVYEADATNSPWTQRCLRQADRIVVVGVAGADPRPGPVEEAVAGMAHAAGVDLVLVQPDDVPLPSGTLAWLTPRSVDDHHHVRMGHDADFGRLSRALTRRSTGLALSGGGARGYVHIGLLRACEELSQPIDRVGGTSMGALIAGAFAMSMRYRFCYEQSAAFGNPKRLIDYTFPIAALTSSRGVTAMLQAMFGDAQIEDLWLPFFCVSTNLTQGERMVHRRGALWHAIRASLAIPGVFTPVLHEGDVLVDGGLMNNYPVDLMREDVRDGVVIGSTAFPKAGGAQAYDFGDTISGWRLLWRLSNPLSRNPRVPSILDTLMSATSINSKQLLQAMADEADLSVSYSIERYGALQFDLYEELVELGYREAKEALGAWLAAPSPPTRSSWTRQAAPNV